MKMLFKEIIKKMTFEEVQKIKMGPAYRWKEELMQRAQQAIISRIDLVETQEEFEDVIDSEIQKLKEDIGITLEMIAKTLYQIPFQMFRQKE